MAPESATIAFRLSLWTCSPRSFTSGPEDIASRPPAMRSGPSSRRGSTESDKPAEDPCPRCDARKDRPDDAGVRVERDAHVRREHASREDLEHENGGRRNEHDCRPGCRPHAGNYPGRLGRHCGVTRALVTGVTGQDGYLLAEQLLSEGAEVFGLARRADADVPAGTHVLVGDLLDEDSLRAAVNEARPDELYHLAAPTYVPDSFEDPQRTMREIAGATEVLLDAAPGSHLRGEQRRDLRRGGVVTAGRGEPEAPAQPLRRGEALRATRRSRRRASAASTRSPGSSTTTSPRAGRNGSCRVGCRSEWRRSSSAWRTS